MEDQTPHARRSLFEKDISERKLVENLIFYSVVTGITIGVAFACACLCMLVFFLMGVLPK
jgi:hypothetical protein